MADRRLRTRGPSGAPGTIVARAWAAASRTVGSCALRLGAAGFEDLNHGIVGLFDRVRHRHVLDNHVLHHVGHDEAGLDLAYRSKHVGVGRGWIARVAATLEQVRVELELRFAGPEFVLFTVLVDRIPAPTHLV